MTNPFAWVPSEEQRLGSNVFRLSRRLEVDGDYGALRQVALDDPERFWSGVRDDLGLVFARGWDTVLDESAGQEWATWFGGGRLNLAESCLHRWARRRPADEAIVWHGEAGERRSVSWAELRAETVRLAEGLSRLGVEAGDRVALLLPLSPEATAASHACAHIGAVQVPIFSGFSGAAVAARIQDSGAKIVITADGTFRRGKQVALKSIVDEAAVEVEHVIVHRRLGGECPMGKRDLWWDELVAGEPGTLPPLELESEARYLLAYTSGTTGRPKGAVHVHGGFLLAIAREAAYYTDVRRGDRVLFVTDLGWIMGPWTIVGAGALGAATIFFEGAPDDPPDRIWRLVEEERATLLGCSPSLIRALATHGPPIADLSSLRAIVTTGEPWDPTSYAWLDEHVCGRGRIPIINVSGGTEVGACFLSPSWLLPTKPVSLGFPGLGIDLDVVDAENNSLRGEVGELVCKRPWPGMTRGIWGDPERYLETYWSRFPGVWAHGDWASVDSDGYWFLHGRSDDTLNIAGKRIGPSELEAPALSCAGVLEAAAIGMPHELKGEVPWLFVVPEPDAAVSVDDVEAAIVAALGKPFRPGRIVLVPTLPRTRSAKIVRRAIRAAALGTDPGDLSTLENPEALDAIRSATEAT